MLMINFGELNILNVAVIYEYHVDEALSHNQNSGSSFLEVDETDVGGLSVRIEDEVAHKKGSTRIVQV
jgi:hypothetical protein